MSARPRPNGDATRQRDPRPVLITGGAGFIGTNLAHRLAASGRSVIVYDNLSRAGVERNLAWLRATHGDRIDVTIADMREAEPLRAAVRRAGQVFHFAAQVAVTTSLLDPLEDLSVNVQGTLGLLEAVRACDVPPPLVFTSTNKVYGALEDIALEAGATRYAPRADSPYRSGVDETRPLDFHSPYGCSKGAADQYVLDYARSYGIDTVVFRMSCIYGPHQYGTEDQGWVAHFLLRAITGEPITIYGDGLQVRDVLHVDDLVEAFQLAEANIGQLRGHAFNIGGGPGNAVSLVDLVERIAAVSGHRPAVAFSDWRTGDQRYYVSDHGKFTRATGWRPTRPAAEGIARLHAWLVENRTAAPAPWRAPPVADTGPAARPKLTAAAARDPVGAS